MGDPTADALDALEPMTDLRAIAEASTDGQTRIEKRENRWRFTATFDDPPTILAMLDIIDAAREVRHRLDAGLSAGREAIILAAAIDRLDVDHD